MAAIDTTEEARYWCFISYRHADDGAQDRGWASWLHQEIERFEVPADLVGGKNKRGDVIPERICPSFRGEVSLSADADLQTLIADALDYRDPVHLGWNATGVLERIDGGLDAVDEARGSPIDEDRLLDALGRTGGAELDRVDLRRTGYRWHGRRVRGAEITASSLARHPVASSRTRRNAPPRSAHDADLPRHELVVA